MGGSGSHARQVHWESGRKPVGNKGLQFLMQPPHLPLPVPHKFGSLSTYPMKSYIYASQLSLKTLPWSLFLSNRVGWHAVLISFYSSYKEGEMPQISSTFSWKMSEKKKSAVTLDTPCHCQACLEGGRG